MISQSLPTRRFCSVSGGHYPAGLRAGRGFSSPNVRAFPIPNSNARREPGGNPVAPRFARIMKRALDFHGKPQLLKSTHYETQTLAHLASGSRICRHGRSVSSVCTLPGKPRRHEEKPTWS